MYSSFPAFCQFQLLRLLHAQTGVFVVLTVSFVLFSSACVVLLMQWDQARAAEAELRELRANGKILKVAAGENNPSMQPGFALPIFQSAILVSTLNQIAADVKLPLEEVTYSLDDSASQPYLRYNITLTVSASYPVVRRFTSQISSELPNVALDAINCTREDIVAAALVCDLTFSAVFRKETRG